MEFILHFTVAELKFQQDKQAIWVIVLLFHRFSFSSGALKSQPKQKTVVGHLPNYPLPAKSLFTDLSRVTDKHLYYFVNYCVTYFRDNHHSQVGSLTFSTIPYNLSIYILHTLSTGILRMNFRSVELKTSLRRLESMPTWCIEQHS